MRLSSAIIIVFLIASVISSADKVTIAVLDLEATGVSASEAASLTNRIRHNLVQTDMFRVIERAQMDEILSEQGFQMTGCTSSECIVEAGKLLGVQRMVGGSIDKVGNMYTIYLRMIDVATGEILTSATSDCNEGIEEVVVKSTGEAVAGLLGQSNPSSGGGSYTQKDKPKEIIGSLPGMKFVTIPSGSFRMGSNDGDKVERPVHTVNISSFQMMTTEVTQAQWQAVMGSNPSNFKGDNLPVEQVSWDDCHEFISKLNQRDPGKGYRLPTEAEWEYACRAGSTTMYYNGDNYSDLDRIAWYYNNSDRKTHPVGQKLPNAWGLYDTLGNVWEWCEDWFHENYNGAPSDGSAWRSPSGNLRVLRSGSWYDPPNFCQIAFRDRYPPNHKLYQTGFRLVRDVDAR